jgi:hypothetical protein
MVSLLKCEKFLLQLIERCKGVSFKGAFPLKHLGSSSQIRPMLGSTPAPLLRASHEQPLDTIQHELVLVRLPQHRPRLT